MKKILLSIASILVLSSNLDAQITTYPYTEDFEGGAAGWAAMGGGTWALGTPAATVINSAASGVNSWVTNLTGNYNNNEVGYVMSPEFDFTAVASPSLQFNLWVNTENNYDGFVVQSSIDGGTTWQNVGNVGDPGWYTNASIWGNPGGQGAGWDGSVMTGWNLVNHALTGLAGQASVYLRMAFGSDGSVTYEGIGFDDINVYDETCPAPTNISTTYLAPDTLIISWTNGLSETAWSVEYGPSGFAQGTGTLASFDTNPDTLTGFSANSLYDFYLQSDCGGGDYSVWQGPTTASTLLNDDVCNAVMVPVDGSTTTYTNVGATTQAGEPGMSPNNTIWFQAIVPPSGNMAIGTCDEGIDTELEVFGPGVDCSNFGSFTSIGYADWNPWGCTGAHPAGIEFCGLTPGDTLTFWVGSWSNGNTGQIPLSLWELSASAGTGSLVEICESDSVNLWSTISGQESNMGTWSYPNNPNTIINDSIFVTGNATVLGNEVYYIISNSCMSDTATVTIDVYGASNAGDDGTINACKEENVNLLSGLSGNVDLGGSWYDPGNNLLAGSEITTSGIVGQYNYDYITSNGVCPDDTANIVVDVADCTADLEDIILAHAIVFPNPVNELLYISNEGVNELFDLEITDVQGKVVLQDLKIVNGTELTELNVGNLETGMYLVRLYNSSSERIFRVVKN